MTDSQLRDAAWAELALTTDSYAAWKKKGYPSSSHWAKAKGLLGQIAAVPTPPPPLSDLFWLPGSYLNKRIPLNPGVHPMSRHFIDLIVASSPAGIWPNGQQYAGAGSPTIYDKAKATTTLKVDCYYGQSTPQKTAMIAWNPAWLSGPTGDRQIAVVDFATGDGYEFQGWEIKGAGTAHAVATFNLRTQDGSSLPGNRVGDAPLLAGINRPVDYLGTEILHAGRCALQVCSSQAVWPALESDGGTAGGPPMGSHLALPRSVSLAQFNLDKWQTMDAVQLQEFGHYASDAGGGYSLSLQSVADGVTTYPALINHLPVELIQQMVVLA